MTKRQEIELATKLGKDQIGKLRPTVDPEWRGRIVKITYMGTKSGRPVVGVADAATGEQKDNPVLPSMFDPNFV